MTDTNKRPVASRLCINLQGDNDEDGTTRPSPLWINPRVDGRMRESVDFSSWLKPNWLEEQGQFSYTRSPSPGADSSSDDDSNSEKSCQQSGGRKKGISFATVVNIKKAANLFRSSRTQAQKRQSVANIADFPRSKTTIGIEASRHSISRNKSVRWMDGNSRKDSVEAYHDTTMISRSKSFSHNEPISGLFDISKAAGKRKPILLNTKSTLPSPAPYSLYLYAQTPQPPKPEKEFKIPKKKRKRLCKISPTEDEEPHKPKIGDRKVSEDELEAIVSRLIRPTNASRARSASISRIFFQHPEKKPQPRDRVDYLVFEPNRFRGLRKVGNNEIEEITERLNMYDIERWPPNSARDEIRKTVKEDKLGVLNSYRWKGIKNC